MERELRYGVCFDCANFESLVDEKRDMYDSLIEKTIEGSESLNIVRAIINHTRNVKK